jgi:hypothetical protein
MFLLNFVSLSKGYTESYFKNIRVIAFPVPFNIMG